MKKHSELPALPRSTGGSKGSKILKLANLFAAFTLFTLFFAACGEAPTRHVFRGGTDFMPLLDNRILHYRQKGQGETYDYTLTLKYIGGREWKVYTTADENIPYGHIEFTSNGVIVEAATLISLTSLESRNEVGAFNQVWLDDGVDVDSSWFDEQTGTETVVAGYERVTVVAGTYDNCLKTVTTPLPEIADSIEARYQRNDTNEEIYLKEREVVNWQTVRWFAEGVGLVKEQVGPPGDPRIIRELVAVESEGVGKIDSVHMRKITEPPQVEPKQQLDQEDDSAEETPDQK